MPWGLRPQDPARALLRRSANASVQFSPTDRQFIEPSVIHAGNVEMSQVQPWSWGPSLAREATTGDKSKYGVIEIITVTHVQR